ncbi:hypothetical protein DESUT3_36330 [Desulfuromonas versatilis]|uniref:Uncharacterized protein n=1 Tax=Desulfuromonas versatilis TaxID=2802975 RepID=A0ABM8HX20_9BACT|nr:hypothetical protein [Desulfuromonas versatilis]BCR06564.1 hypothetical protein DESUT3_36330 [Desulfuromonas versatilis]
MILHGGILALLAGSGIVFLMMLYACALALRILARWDFRSSSDVQLALERRTYLVSTIVHYALGFEIISLVLFVHTLDDIHPLFVGAMCATGALNANPVGWSALTVKLVAVFAAALWLGANHLDQRAEDSPLVRPKYGALLLLTPLLGVSLYLQGSYFLGLQPEIITSCCGSLFGSGEAGVAGELAGLPPEPTMKVFYGSLLAWFGCVGLALKSRLGLWRYLVGLLSPALFFISLASVVSFISLYIYQLPTHHCPFDMFQGHYRFIGYPLYLGLFGGTLFGLLTGLAQPLKRRASLRGEVERSERRWLWLALVCMLMFLTTASWQMLFGQFTLLGY